MAISILRIVAHVELSVPFQTRRAGLIDWRSLVTLIETVACSWVGVVCDSVLACRELARGFVVIAIILGGDGERHGIEWGLVFGMMDMRRIIVEAGENVLVALGISGFNLLRSLRDITDHCSVSLPALSR